MTRAHALFLAMAAGLGAAGAAEASVTLVEDGRPQGVIVAVADADRPAAEELADVLERITGAGVPVVEAAPGQGPRALVGAAAEGAFTTDEIAGLSYDGYRIRARGEVLAIAGRTPAGTMNGVCGFLQDHLGVRWFMPSELFEVLPETSTIRVAECDELEQPTFDCRLFSGLDGNYQEAWRRHLRLSVRSWEVPFAAGFSHWLYGLFPPSKFAETDPEIYPIINGERVRPTSDRQPGWQPCTGNPRTIEIAIQQIRRYFDEHPAAHSYSVSINDNDRWCECELCTALDVPHEFRGRQCHSDRYYTFVNAVARGVRETHPDKFIGCFAYAGVEPPPKTIARLEPNVFVNITQDTSQYFDPSYRRQDYDFWRQWLAKCRQMGKYDYSGLGAIAPRYYPHLLADDLRHSARIGLVAMHTEAYPYWSNYGPMIYVQARMMWDVSLDEDQLLDEFFEKLYGPAAPPMRAFYEDLERIWMTPREGRWFAGIGSAAQQCDIYSLDGLAALEHHLLEAARRAPQGVVAERVAYVRKCFRYPALFIRGWLTARRLRAATDPGSMARDLATLTRISRNRDRLFHYSVLEDDLSTSWYDTHAGRARVQSEWRSMVEGAMLKAAAALGGRGDGPTLDGLIDELAQRDPRSTLVLTLRAKRGDFDDLPNLLQNPGFEETGQGDNPQGPEWEAADAPPGWSVWRESPGSGRIWRDTETVRSGDRSAALTGGECMCYIARVPVTPGRHYVGWAHIKARDIDPPRRTTFEIRWNDAQGAWHAAGAQVRAEAQTAGRWTRVTAAAQAPEGAASAVVLLVAYGIADDETVWFDDAFLAEVPQ
ncbi:MAG: DUF4838 domain-containing protein [Armatimonadota bacterium]|nr:DUF4838 domain-containing protein [Armatimonadota bacterium]